MASRRLFENSDELLTAKQLAKALKISLSKIYEMRADGDLPFYEIGSQYRFRLSEVLEAFSGKVEVKRAGRSNRKDKLWLV